MSTGSAIPNWNRSSFRMEFTQETRIISRHELRGRQCGNSVTIPSTTASFAELTADQQGTAIYRRCEGHAGHS